MSKPVLYHFRRKDLDKEEVEETAGKMQFHLPCKLPLHQLPNDHQGTLLATLLLKSNLLYTNTEVNIIHWDAVQRADCTKLVKRHYTNRPLKGTARPGPYYINWACYSTSSSTVLVPEGAVPAQAERNHTYVGHSAHRANTASAGSLEKIQIFGSTEKAEMHWFTCTSRLKQAATSKKSNDSICQKKAENLSSQYTC